VSAVSDVLGLAGWLDCSPRERGGAPPFLFPPGTSVEQARRTVRMVEPFVPIGAGLLASLLGPRAGRHAIWTGVRFLRWLTRGFAGVRRWDRRLSVMEQAAYCCLRPRGAVAQTVAAILSLLGIVPL